MFPSKTCSCGSFSAVLFAALLSGCGNGADAAPSPGATSGGGGAYQDATVVFIGSGGASFASGGSSGGEAPTPCSHFRECTEQNLFEMSCDPDSHTCVPDCDAERNPCAAGKTCFNLVCVERCVPFSPCSGGRTCVPTRPDNSEGVCLTADPPGEGQACEVSSDSSTGCALGLYCSGAVCRRICDMFYGNPACPNGKLCSIFGLCIDATLGDSAALGEPCSPVPTAGVFGGTLPCAPDGQAFRGWCAVGRTSGGTCNRVCPDPGSPTCPPREICSMACAN